VTDGRKDRQNYDSQDRASTAESRGNKINQHHLTFGDKFMIKTCENVKDFLPEDCRKNFLTIGKEQ